MSPYGEVRAARECHLRDDDTVAKMGHPASYVLATKGGTRLLCLATKGIAKCSFVDVNFREWTVG
jgi:hypothetical protein